MPKYISLINWTDKGVAEVLILKQRNGPTGRLNLRFAGENTRFDNLAQNFRAPQF